jgi:pilus assembly protein CpaF
MPVVSSLHSVLLPLRIKQNGDAIGSNINEIVSEITFNILKEQPSLVADIAAGRSDASLLEKAVIRELDRNRYHLGLYREQLIKKVMDFMFGYGLLQQYVEDEEISDIDGTKYNDFTVTRNGVRQRIDVDFGSEKMLEGYCKLIALRNGGVLNENDSQCRVTDEKRRMRINISIRPRNVSGAAISIRKHRLKSYSIEDLVHCGMLTEQTARILRELALSDATILFCGKGAAGKTTLLRAFVNSLPEMERVLIAETDAEIYPEKPCCIEQRIKKENEGGVKVTLRELVRDGLTMSLDTYCVGEIVGDEAWEFIKAAYTGHRGLATIHSESAEDTFGRLLALSKGAGIGESESTIKEMMVACIDYIFYLKKFKVTRILSNPRYDKTLDKLDFTVVYSVDG